MASFWHRALAGNLLALGVPLAKMGQLGFAARPEQVAGAVCFT
jgi:hypothetical protein